MPKPFIKTKKIAPDEIQVTVVDFKPTPEEIKEQEVPEPLRKGILARDVCGDGTEEYVLNDPPAIWRNSPVKYYIDSSIPSQLIPGIDKSFEEFNNQAGFKLYEKTTGTTQITVLLGPIDTRGATLAQAQWSYSPSSLTMTKASITFDSNENWSILSQESCGAIGSIFDIGNVASHEIGHVSCLAHAPTDKLQTMYATTSPGKTLGRTLGNGDKKGFRKAYNISDKPPEPTPEPQPTPPPEPQPQPNPPSEQVDKFGVKKIYPDKPKGFFIEKTGGGDIEEHGDYRREWEIDTPPYENIEITGYFKVHIDREDTISIKPKGAHHSGKEPQYSACCNIHYVPFKGTGKYLGKQCPHLNYKEAKGIKPKFELKDIRDRWIGIKAIEWNEGKNVHWQTFIDEGEKNDWKLWIDYVEKDCSIGDDKDTCPPFTKSPWAGDLPPTILMRVDFPEKPPKNDVEAKKISAREIAVGSPSPTPSPEPTPTPPTPTPTPSAHKLTKAQKIQLKTAQTAYEIAKKTGDANVIKIAKEQLDDISCQILTELHS